MKISLAGLTSLCYTNVVELKFRRRIQKPGRPANRRMLCTSNLEFLNSDKAKLYFRFETPIKNLKFSPFSKGLVSVYDLFMLDWRLVPFESTEIISFIPLSPEDKFWEYFNGILINMTADQKAAFIDK